jgi:hypothetical protein
MMKMALYRMTQLFYNLSRMFLFQMGYIFGGTFYRLTSLKTVHVNMVISHRQYIRFRANIAMHLFHALQPYL